MTTSPFDVEDGRRVLEACRVGVAKVQGMREFARRRETELVKVVGEAKGRLAAKREVDRFLEEFQSETARRNVESFERLLTSLARQVVGADAPAVRFELTTERNLPSLDIAAVSAKGRKEDLYEDNGGALTNVVSTGLRLIAVVKSRSAPFLALDEADCWVSPVNVPSYYVTLADAARRLDVQTLAITHHDVTSFGADIDVWRIHGTPEDGVAFEGTGPAREWADQDKPGVRWLRLVDVQGYVDATLPLSPGVTALTGHNNGGKSTMMRALRALFLGETRDSLVRHGASRCVVEAGVAGTRTLRFVRQPGKTPVNVWSLHEKDGSVVEDDGFRHETGGRNLPDWVAVKFGIAPVHELDVHLAHQKRPVFLLGDAPAKRASVLSVGQQADHVRRMIVLHRERNMRDTTTVREGERELDGRRRLMDRLSVVDEVAESLEVIAHDLAGAASTSHGLARAQAVLVRVEEAGAAAARSRASLAALDILPTPADMVDLTATVRVGAVHDEVGERTVRTLSAWEHAGTRHAVLSSLPSDVPGIMDTETALKLGLSVHGSRTAGEKAGARRDILSTLPSVPPVSVPTDVIQSLEAAIASSARSVEAARASSERLARERVVLDRQLREILERTGGQCPACGQVVEDPATLVEGHAHP